MNDHEQTPLLPTVSVVIPTYNRADFLSTCLPPLLAQTYDHQRYEIIFVDDGSTDNTVQRIHELTTSWDGTCRVISKPNGGPASARNVGIHASEADVIVFIDSDCVAAPDWLHILINAMQKLGAAGIGAPVTGTDNDNWVARYMEAIKFYRHRVKNGQVDYLITGNVAFLRAALLAVGGFEDQPGVWGEDVDLSFKLRDAGYQLAVIDQGAVKHYGTPSSVRALARNLYRYGQGTSTLSAGWNRKRKPVVELIRHLGAVVLSPYIALSRVRQVGLAQALSFIPLIIVEHTAFSLGILTAMLRNRKMPPTDET